MTIYVSEEDKLRERRVCKFMTNVYGGQFLEVPGTLAPVDAVWSFNGVITHVVEIKSRTTPHDAYDTYIINRSKIDGLNELADRLGCRALFLVEFSDALCRVDTRKSYLAEVTGRTDRNDPNDVQEAVHVPISDMTILGRSQRY